MVGGGPATGTTPAASTRNTSPRKVDGQRWLDGMTASVVTGQHVDPKAGRVSFSEYAEQWHAIQVHRPTTQANTGNDAAPAHLPGPS